MLSGIPRIVVHALAAGAFFFCFQYLLMAQPLDTSTIWAIAGAAAAACLAWMQHRRGQ